MKEKQNSKLKRPQFGKEGAEHSAGSIKERPGEAAAKSKCDGGCWPQGCGPHSTWGVRWMHGAGHTLSGGLHPAAQS